MDVNLKLPLALLLALTLPVAARACAVEAKATVALEKTAVGLTLPVEVNDSTGTFILDTGAQRSVVTAEAAQRLGLRRDEWVGTTMRGVGGIDRRPNADPRRLSLGGVPLVRRTLSRDHSLTVGELPALQNADNAVDGLLGRDYLALFDLDLDLPGRKLTLYDVRGCAGRFLPWSGQYTSIQVTMLAEDAVMLPVVLDGRPLRAMLDTGATSSLLAAPGMYKMGLEAGALAGDPAVRVTGLGTRALTVRQHRYGLMMVGQQRIESPVLWVEPVRLSPIADMILGADWLQGRRVWLSFATKQLFLAQ
jgi:hypothetical protein